MRHEDDVAEFRERGDVTSGPLVCRSLTAASDNACDAPCGWGYQGVEGDPATAARLQERLTAGDPTAPEQDQREVHRAALAVVEEFFGLSLPKDPIVSGRLPAVLLEPA